MLKTVIVEDDRMVAAINAEFAQKAGGVEVIASFHNGKDALAFLQYTQVDLILLDLYMPDISGLELLTQLRRNEYKADVIFITAANDIENIQKALQLGAIDYLIKPFTYERFEEALDKVVLRHKVMEQGIEVTQEDIDIMIQNCRPNPISRNAELEKGIQRPTLEHIRAYLDTNKNEYRTAEQISSEIGLSKVTVRRYLNYLISQGEAKSRTDYSTGGRPRVEYRKA